MYKNDGDKIKYSLIIPIYNGARFISGIRKIIDTLPAYCDIIEVLLVDDGSIDESLVLCQRIAQSFPFVKVISKTHTGISETRNTGILHARGTWVLFSDQDDYLNAGDLVQFLEQQTFFDLLVFSFQQGDGLNTFDGRKLSVNIFDLHGTSLELQAFLLEHYKEFAGSVWNKVYRRDFIEKYKIYFFKESVIGNEDILFNLMYLCHCRKIKFSCNVFYYYLIHDFSASHKRENKFEIIKRFCNGTYIFERYISENNIELSEFLFYFWIKQVLLSARSYDVAFEKKIENMVTYCLNNNKFLNICLNAKDCGKKYFEKQEFYSEEECTVLCDLREAVLLQDKKTLEEKLIALLKKNGKGSVLTPLHRCEDSVQSEMYSLMNY